jgi:ABC-type antimicrobial peptide transport system permease subunit
VFFLAYLRSELLRRRARTILTLLGLALGVALVIAIAALSRGLDRAQKTALDPLASIGTDLSVTRSADGADPPEVFASTRSVVTDLSKLGKPGDKFVHDFFLPGTQLSFERNQAKEIASIPGVEDVALGLTLLAVHQEGTVPEIVARFQTGGQEFRIDRAIKPLTDAERAKVQACLEENGGGAQPQPAQPGQRGGGGGLRFGLGPLNQCLPERFRRVRETFVTPRETLQQVLDPPQTDIESRPYTIAGVDTTKPGMGLVTLEQVTSGRFLARGAKEALVGETYARRRKLKVGSKLNLNGTRFTVVGLVEPPLGGQSADVYLPLGRLQKLAGQEGAANVILVRADSSDDVAAVQKAIEDTVPGAEVASAQQVADSISGSLVDAADLSRTLGLALSIAAALAAFLLAALLTLASVGKRVRELGTLKALGWSQRLVVRQVVGESLVQGLAGGLLGVVLGLAAAAAIGAFGPTLSASSTTGGGDGFFGLGEVAARTVTSDASLTAPVTAAIVLLGFGLAVVGGLVAGAAGALRAARLRPADAMRRVD